MNTSLESFMAKIKNNARSTETVGKVGDLKQLAGVVTKAVSSLLDKVNAVRPYSRDGYLSKSNEALTFDNLQSACGVDALEQLMVDCHIPSNMRAACMQECAIAMHRTLMNGRDCWLEQSKTADHAGNGTSSLPLSTMYPASVADTLTSGQEAFGANIDMVVPDMKITLTTAIMNFHARIMPRFVPTRTVDQPNASYTKEYLEIYDNSTMEGDSMRLVDLYADPKFARNELQRVIPLEANDVVKAFVVKDGILQFGPVAKLKPLCLRNDLPGYDKANRTDLIEENVKLEYVYVSLSDGVTTEIFQCPVPIAWNRLSRVTNGHDSADRAADLKFRIKLNNQSIIASNSVEGTWTSATTTLLANLANDEFIALDITAKPSVNIKFATADCQGSFTVSAHHATDDDLIKPETITLAGKLAQAANHVLVGYTLDARWSEANLRKTNIAMMTHRVPMSYDIPVGRNYTFDYAIGQVNAEENAVNLTKVIGIGQDDVVLTALMALLENTYDRINNYTVNENNPADYVGADFVAGDKIRPTIFQGTLDFSKLNIIRDADRFGDVRQKALSYLNGAIARMMQLSFLQQQLGGGTTATFKVLTSMEVLSNVFAVEHIHNHMSKADQRDLGDGVEYVLVLPNGVRLEFITSTFNYMRDKCVIVPSIPNNAESELNFGHLWNNGDMVAHYTPTEGRSANNRLFANIRELLVVTAPIGAIIDIAGLDIVSGIAENSVLRPTIITEQETPYL